MKRNEIDSVNDSIICSQWNTWKIGSIGYNDSDFALITQLLYKTNKNMERNNCVKFSRPILLSVVFITNETITAYINISAYDVEWAMFL